MASGPGAQRDLVRRISDLEAEVRRLSVRPRRKVPSPTFTMEGAVDLSRFFPPAHMTLDIEAVTEEYPEDKLIVGVDGWIQSGEAHVRWAGQNGVFLAEHVIVPAVSNRVILPEPYEIEGWDWILPTLITGTAGEHLSCTFLVEHVPI